MNMKSARQSALPSTSERSGEESGRCFRYSEREEYCTQGLYDNTYSIIPICKKKVHLRTPTPEKQFVSGDTLDGLQHVSFYLDLDALSFLRKDM